MYFTDPGQLFASLAGGYFFLLASFAAITTAQALEEDDGAGLPRRVFWSLTKSSLFLGLPGLIGFLMFLNHDAGGRGGGGIMSKDTGLFLLFLAGCGGLVLLWLCAITLGFIGSTVVRNMRPMAGAGLLFLFVCGAPVLSSLLSVYSAAQQKRLRRNAG